MSDFLSDLMSEPTVQPAHSPPVQETPSQIRKSVAPPNRKSRHKPGKGNPDRKGQAKPYTKALLPKSIQTYALRAHYSVYTSLHQFASNIDTIYEVLIARDRKLEETITSSLLKYVALLAAYSRIHVVRQLVGIDFPTPFSRRALEISEYLHLPEFIASAIETIGQVSHDDRSYVPWIPIHPRKESRYFKPLEDVYSELTGQRSDDYLGLIDTGLLFGYQTAIVRGIKSGVLFRKVDFTNKAGSENFLVAVEHMDSRVRGLSPWIMSEPVAQLGALWGWRALHDIRPNRGETSTLDYGFATKGFEHQLHLVDLCSASFK